MIAEGQRAPDFEATDEQGNSVSVSSLRGHPIVLHFFALAWSGV